MITVRQAGRPFEAGLRTKKGGMVVYIQKPTLEKEAEDQPFNGIQHYLTPRLKKKEKEKSNQTCGSLEVSLQMSEAGSTLQF